MSVLRIGRAQGNRAFRRPALPTASSENVTTKPGETRPPRLATRRSSSATTGTPRLSRSSCPASPSPPNSAIRDRSRCSTAGRSDGGFRICEWCGFGQPVHGTKAAKAHIRIDRPGKPCNGPLALLQLEHEFLTDVLELEINVPVAAEDVRSALYAVLEAAPALDVARDDIDGTLHYGAIGRPSLVLFDAVAPRTFSALADGSPSSSPPRSIASAAASAARRPPATPASAAPQPAVPRSVVAGGCVGGAAGCVRFGVRGRADRDSIRRVPTEGAAGGEIGIWAVATSLNSPADDRRVSAPRPADRMRVSPNGGCRRWRAGR